MVIDAHLHLWDKQLGRVGENKVVALKDGKSNFGGEILHVAGEKFAIRRIFRIFGYALDTSSRHNQT